MNKHRGFPYKAMTPQNLIMLTGAISIRRNAFLAIFTSIELIFLNVKKITFSNQAFVVYLIYLMTVKHILIAV